MEAGVGKERANKNKIDQRLTINDCNTTLVNTRLGVRVKKKQPILWTEWPKISSMKVTSTFMPYPRWVQVKLSTNDSRFQCDQGIGVCVTIISHSCNVRYYSL